MDSAMDITYIDSPFHKARMQFLSPAWLLVCLLFIAPLVWTSLFSGNYIAAAIVGIVLGYALFYGPYLACGNLISIRKYGEINRSPRYMIGDLKRTSGTLSLMD